MYQPLSAPGYCLFLLFSASNCRQFCEGVSPLESLNHGKANLPRSNPLAFVPNISRNSKQWFESSRQFSVWRNKNRSCPQYLVPRILSKGKRKPSSLKMALVPLSVEDLSQLLVVWGPPTGAQAATYWGRTQQERYGRIFESSVVTILGVIFSYFLSFVLGGFVATILGSIFFFWSVFSPQLKAYQRNWELRGGRELVDPWIVEERRSFRNWIDNGEDDNNESRQGLYGALFLGRLEDVGVVEEASAPAEEEYDVADFSDYNMEADELERWAGTPYLIRVNAQDLEGRTLQVHARMSEEYVNLEPGFPVVGVMLSTSQRFTSLAALTDIFVPDLGCWIGDYPYLDRAKMEQLLADDDEIWNLLQGERLEDENTNNNFIR